MLWVVLNFIFSLLPFGYEEIILSSQGRILLIVLAVAVIIVLAVVYFIFTQSVESATAPSNVAVISTMPEISALAHSDRSLLINQLKDPAIWPYHKDARVAPWIYDYPDIKDNQPTYSENLIILNNQAAALLTINYVFWKAGYCGAPSGYIFGSLDLWPTGHSPGQDPEYYLDNNYRLSVYFGVMNGTIATANGVV